MFRQQQKQTTTYEKTTIYNNDGRGMRIEDWEEFIKGCCVGGEVFGYHSIIPFKHYKTIVQQISWSTSENDYCLANNNCEHYVNSRIFGLSYSKQVEERPNKARDNSHGITTKYGECGRCRDSVVNNGESGSFCLKERLKKNFSKIVI